MRYLIALLLAICILANGEIIVLNRQAARAAYPETVNLTMVYMGSCEQFDILRPNIRLSTLSGSCLPFSSTAPFPDNSDLDAHVLCTRVGRNVAQIDFLEIFQVYGTPFSSPYIMSFVPNAPFRIESVGVSYLRRPSCSVHKDWCSTNNYIDNCWDNPVIVKKGFVVTNDTIYVIPRETLVSTCTSGTDTCCEYINTAYCPRNTTTTLLDLSKFRKKKPHYKYGHNEEEHGHHQHNNKSHGKKKTHKNPKKNEKTEVPNPEVQKLQVQQKDTEIQQTVNNQTPTIESKKEIKEESKEQTKPVEQHKKKKTHKKHKKPKKAHKKPATETQQVEVKKETVIQANQTPTTESKEETKPVVEKKKPQTAEEILAQLDAEVTSESKEERKVHKKKPKKVHKKPKKAHKKPANSDSQVEVQQTQANETPATESKESKEETKPVVEKKKHKKVHKKKPKKKVHKKPKKAHKKPATVTLTSPANPAPIELTKPVPQMLSLKPAPTKKPKHHDEDYDM